MFGSQCYSEGRFEPQRGGGVDWHVWCCTGAIKVLTSGEFQKKISEKPSASFTVNFANGSAARISPEHPLWELLKNIAKEFQVKVYPLTWKGEYEPWTGEKGSISAFDAICISSK